MPKPFLGYGFVLTKAGCGREIHNPSPVRLRTEEWGVTSAGLETGWRGPVRNRHFTQDVQAI